MSIAPGYGSTVELRAQLEQSRAELAAARADPTSYAYKTGYAQAQDEARMEQMFCPHCNPCRHAEQISVLRDQLAAARAAEKQLRHLLFMAHGNAEHYLYGDDGERQCNTCMIDFNVDTPSEIEQKITDYWNRKAAIAGEKK